MIYKSLLYADSVPDRSIKPDVISDLKLDMVLPSEVTDILLYKPDRESLYLRRELFEKLLSDPSSEGALSEILDSLSYARELYRALNLAVCMQSSAYIFVFLFDEVVKFCGKVTLLKKAGFLYQRFSDTFKAFSESEKFKAAEEELKSLLPELSVIKEVILSNEGENTKVLKSTGNCISESLRRCAKELGIPLSEKAEEPVQFQKNVSEAIAKMYPSQFERSLKFYDNYRTLLQGEIFGYTSEIEFVLGMIRFIRRANEQGIPYSFPAVSEKKEIELKNVYDITLLKKEGTHIVPNDVCFNEKEPFFYLTGANGGGKTTYIRAVGTAVIFFLNGAPVFCEGGRCGLFSSVYTHFPRDERFEGSGRFVDEEKRVNEILSADDGNSLILLNETFSTTGEEKAVKCTEELAEKLYKSGSFGVYITHQHSIDEQKIPFLSVVVDESDSNRRTYKIEKRRTESFSFAKDILKKYGLTGQALKERFGLNKD